MFKIFHVAYAFILKSSADSQKTSATVKYALLGLIPLLMQATDIVCRYGYECVALDASLLEQIVDTVALFIFLSLSALSALGILFGLFRKVYLTAIGENEAVNAVIEDRV